VQVDANDEDATEDAIREAVENAVNVAVAVRNGRTLSMTKDAIRKREARAAAKATQGGWPAPKA
jgi:predicted ThiF/HesA family dinucleotide-utilizing enzyme